MAPGVEAASGPDRPTILFGTSPDPSRAKPLQGATTPQRLFVFLAVPASKVDRVSFRLDGRVLPARTTPTTRAGVLRVSADALDLSRSPASRHVISSSFDLAGRRATVTARFRTSSGPVAWGDKKPLLIKHGWDVPTPGQMSANQNHIDALPVDGIAVSLDALDAGTMSGRAYSLSDYRASVSKVPAMSKVKHNFALVTMRETEYDFDDDALWSTINVNFTHLARALKESGKFDGIIFDNEYYGGPESVWSFEGGQADIATVSATVRSRGSQMMKSISAGWPEARVLSFFGPWVANPATAEALSGLFGYVPWPLLEPFMHGMIEATSGTRTQFIDGGEMYALRSKADFSRAGRWMKSEYVNALAKKDPALRAAYRSNVKVGFGIYDRDTQQGEGEFPTISPQEFATTAANALAVSNSYVWLYTESYDWLRTGKPERPVPDSWVSQLARARQSPRR